MGERVVRRVVGERLPTKTNVYIAVGRVTLSNATIMTITSNSGFSTIFD